MDDSNWCSLSNILTGHSNPQMVRGATDVTTFSVSVFYWINEQCKSIKPMVDETLKNRKASPS